MQKIILIAAGIFLTLSGCNNNSNEVNQSRERDSLLTVITQRENTMNEFIMDFNEVERILDSVSAKQQLILLKSKKSGDSKLDRKSRINAEIKAINILMESNKQKVKSLYAKLNRSDSRNVQLEKTVVMLNNQLNNKYFELAALNEEIRQLNVQMEFMEMSVDLLMVQNFNQEQTINNKTNEMHAAYYIVAGINDLQQWELVDKQGGFLGIGQNSKLSNNLDKNMFTKIDYMEITSIPVNSKGIKIITTHPTGSFSLDKKGRMVNSIMISDPEKFWSVSKYLVVSK